MSRKIIIILCILMVGLLLSILFFPSSYINNYFSNRTNLKNSLKSSDLITTLYFAPDGKKIIFLEKTASGKENNIIWMIDIDKKISQKLIEDINISEISGINDRYILFMTYTCQNNSKQSLLLFDIKYKQKIKLNITFDYNPWPYLTKDNIYYSYTENNESFYDLWKMNINASNLTRITHEETYELRPIVNLYLNKILFTENRYNHRGDLSIINLDGTNKTQVTKNLSVDQYILLNNGDIIMNIVERGVNIVPYKINSSSRKLEKLDYFYYYSLDNSKKAYIKNYREIWVMNSDDTNRTKIFELEIPESEKDNYDNKNFEYCYLYIFLSILIVLILFIYPKLKKNNENKK